MSFHSFYVGHVLECLRQMPNESVNSVVTSPPYYLLRDYQTVPVSWPEVEYIPMPGLVPISVPGWKGQLGLEPTPEMYVGHMVLAFREVWRILQKDGTLWLNFGDSYAGSRCGTKGDMLTGRHVVESDEFIKSKRKGKRWGGGDIVVPSLPIKNLIGIPWRVAFALQADGFWLRMDIPWDKVNAMPESVTDRPTRSHEYVFLLTRSARYWYDAEAIKEPSTIHLSDKRYGPGAGGRNREDESWNQNGPYKPHKGFKSLDCSAGRNSRSVWRIPTASFVGAHYAVFPDKLAEKCMLAGCPPGGIILDPFGGRGTVTKMAMKHERNSIYVDLSPKSCNLALEYCGFSGPRLLDCHEFEVVRLDGADVISAEEVVQG